MSPPAYAAALPPTKVRVGNATPDVARMLAGLGLAWMLEGRPLPVIAPANEPMRAFAA